MRDWALKNIRDLNLVNTNTQVAALIPQLQATVTGLAIDQTNFYPVLPELCIYPEQAVDFKNRILCSSCGGVWYLHKSRRVRLRRW